MTSTRRGTDTRAQCSALRHARTEQSALAAYADFEIKLEKKSLTAPLLLAAPLVLHFQ
jgi:hypothetical protein